MIRQLMGMLFMLFCSSACKQPSKIAGPPGYDLSKPEIINMPPMLNEISGIAFNRGKADTIFAEQDEEGRLFAFVPSTGQIKERKFGKKGDYEDIAVVNGTAVILRSDGTLFSFPLPSWDEPGDITGVRESTGLVTAGEYEAMCADESAGLLYLLCKDCREDNASKTITGSVLQLAAGKIQFKSSFQLNVKDIAAKAGKKKVNFRPSALAKHPALGEWYILSSVNKLLLITDEQWAVKAVYPLDGGLFVQPEGIAFDKDNNLYISNERAPGGKATVLRFTFAKDKN